MTFFYAQYDQLTQRLAHVNAGHNPPFFLRAGQADGFTDLTAGGLFVWPRPRDRDVRPAQ